MRFDVAFDEDGNQQEVVQCDYCRKRVCKGEACSEYPHMDEVFRDNCDAYHRSGYEKLVD